jgi:hypothetical protein
MLLKSSLSAACSLWPLSEKFGFTVEMKENPLSKVVVLMPQVTPVIGAQELGATFEARITNVASLLVGNYNITKHNAYKGLRHRRLNQVFDLASVLCQSHPEPIVCKQKIVVSLSALVLPSQKTDQKWRRVKGSSCLGDQTSTQELALVKALKPSKKFILGSSGLSLAKKASTAKDGIHGGKRPCPAPV